MFEILKLIIQYLMNKDYLQSEGIPLVIKEIINAIMQNHDISTYEMEKLIDYITQKNIDPELENLLNNLFEMMDSE